MRRIAALMVLLRDIPLHLRRLGPGYLWYFLAHVMVPWLVYWTLYWMPGDRLQYTLLTGAEERYGSADLARTPLRRARWLGGLATAATGVLVVSVLAVWFDVRVASLGLAGAAVGAILARFVVVAVRKLRMRSNARRLLEAVDRTSRGEEAFGRWADLPVTQTTRRAVDAAMSAVPGEALVIGRIDLHGRVLGLYGAIRGCEPTTEAEFIEGPVCVEEIVISGGLVLRRQSYKDDSSRFLRQWYHLALLEDSGTVPTIHHVDEDHRELWAAFRPGLSLATASAGSSPMLPQTFWDHLAHDLDVIHSRGVVGMGLAAGALMVDSDGTPFFTDFSMARRLRSTSGLRFRVMRDRDRVGVNQLYDRTILTERSARAALAARIRAVQANEGWYSTIDFGSGLFVGPIWITSHGPGRWRYLNGRVVAPLARGGRVLDLGSNNGVLPMMMLRDGARSVLGVELSPHHAQAADTVRKVYEWRDMRQYDLMVINSDMREVLNQDWGEFDVVTAFCSLYYLEADDMAEVVHRASELAPMMIVQANTLSKPTDRHDRAGLDFLRALLEENGFPRVELHAAAGYNRPLLVGRVAAERRSQPGV